MSVIIPVCRWVLAKLSDLTSAAAVRQAVAEFDKLGRSAFLEKYQFGEARSYFLLHHGNCYDSKAIAGAAIGFQHPKEGPLTGRDFVGGKRTVQPKLESLGFTVVSRE